MIRTLIKSYMADHGVTYRQLSALTGIDYSVLHRYVNGRSMDLGNYNKLIAWVFR